MRYRAGVIAQRFVQRGVETAVATDETLAAISDADVVLLAPSNPVVSIGTILGIPGVRTALLGTRAPVVGISPIIGGSAVRGMANACLTTIGVEVSAAAVAAHYGATIRWRGARRLARRHRRSRLSPLVLHASGITVEAAPLWMTDPNATAAMARAALGLAARLSVISRRR